MINDCKIELKNIKVNQAMSEETVCYSASVYLNGQRVGEVMNRGHGGCDETRIDLEVYRQMNEWCIANLPEIVTDMPDPHDKTKKFTYPQDFESLCHAQVETFQNMQDLKRLMRAKVLYLDPDRDTLYQLSFKGVRSIDRQHIDHAKRKLPAGTKILNEMPEDEALKIYLEKAA